MGNCRKQSIKVPSTFFQFPLIKNYNAVLKPTGAISDRLSPALTSVACGHLCLCVQFSAALS